MPLIVQVPHFSTQCPTHFQEQARVEPHPHQGQAHSLRPHRHRDRRPRRRPPLGHHDGHPVGLRRADHQLEQHRCHRRPDHAGAELRRDGHLHLHRRRLGLEQHRHLRHDQQVRRIDHDDPRPDGHHARHHQEHRHRRREHLHPHPRRHLRPVEFGRRQRHRHRPLREALRRHHQHHRQHGRLLGHARRSRRLVGLHPPRRRRRWHHRVQLRRNPRLLRRQHVPGPAGIAAPRLELRQLVTPPPNTGGRRIGSYPAAGREPQPPLEFPPTALEIIVTDIRDTTPTETPLAPAAVRADDVVTLDAQHIDLDSLTPRPRRTVIASIALIVVTALGVALIAAALLFHLQGGSWFIVKTPSMGTAAPVGTLVLTTPTTADDLHVGDVIAFHPPTSPTETYTHRVVGIGKTGLISTRGDINGATDPWQLTDSNLVGKATAVLPGLGWLIRGLPIVLLGLITVWLLTARVKIATRKVSYRITGVSLVVSVTAFILKPFTGVVVEQVTTTGGHPGAIVVSTGLLPIRVQAVHGTHADLATGQVGHVTVPASAHQDFYSLSTALHLGFWGWVVFGFICLLPLLWTMIVGLPPKQDEVVA
nr:signal peptidase I [Frondihabitans sp. VKM Ac-2883]